MPGGERVPILDKQSPEEGKGWSPGKDVEGVPGKCRGSEPGAACSVGGTGNSKEDSVAGTEGAGHRGISPSL